MPVGAIFNPNVDDERIADVFCLVFSNVIDVSPENVYLPLVSRDCHSVGPNLSTDNLPLKALRSRHRADVSGDSLQAIMIDRSAPSVPVLTSSEAVIFMIPRSLCKLPVSGACRRYSYPMQQAVPV